MAILENGAQSLLIANDFDLLKRFSEDGYLIVSEVFDLGIDNSPTLVKSHGVLNRNVVLKTSNLTTALEQNSTTNIVISCFNNLGATFDFLKSSNYQNIEVVPAGYMAHQQMNFEDIHCAEILVNSLERGELILPDNFRLQAHVSEMIKSKPRTAHYIDDLHLAIIPNISKGIATVIKKSNGLFEVSLNHN